MSIESDSDRLDIVRTLAGIERDDVMVRHPGGAFAATFDRPSALTPDGSVEVRQTVLVARSIDVCNLVKDTVLSIGNDEYRVKRLEPDGTGMTAIILRH
jgi:hypothetical protein